MPRKLQPKEIQGEPDEEYKVRKDRAVKNMETEIELLRLRERRKATEFKEIDETMLELINQKFISCENIRKELEKSWNIECETEQRKSAELLNSLLNGNSCIAKNESDVIRLSAV